MKTFRVYYQIPALAYIEVNAQTEDAAKAMAETARTHDEDPLTDYEVDYDADAELAFVIQTA